MRFFVYGSLKHGQYNSYLLRNATFLGNYITAPRFTMFNVSGIYPAVMEGGETAIHGEVYEVKNYQDIQNIYDSVGYSMNNPEYFSGIDIHTIHGISKMFVITNKLNYKIVKDGKW